MVAVILQPKTTVILKHCYLFTHWLVRTSDQCILIVDAFRCVLFLNKLNNYLIEAQYGRQKSKTNDRMKFPSNTEYNETNCLLLYF